jgi:hypothetical protein
MSSTFRKHAYIVQNQSLRRATKNRRITSGFLRSSADGTALLPRKMHCTRHLISIKLDAVAHSLNAILDRHLELPRQRTCAHNPPKHAISGGHSEPCRSSQRIGGRGAKQESLNTDNRPAISRSRLDHRWLPDQQELLSPLHHTLRTQSCLRRSPWP